MNRTHDQIIPNLFNKQIWYNLIMWHDHVIVLFLGELTTQVKQINRHFCRYCDKFFSKPANRLRSRQWTCHMIKLYQIWYNLIMWHDHVNLLFLGELTTQVKQINRHFCRYCDKFFSKPANVLKHERIHTGEKPYQCSYCDKAFSDSSAFYKHHRLHTGEKRHTCEICGEKFAEKMSLRKHKMKHFA